MTTVPVRESMTTRATVSGSTGQFADLRHVTRDADFRRAKQFDGPAVDLERRAAAETLLRIGVDRVDDAHRGVVIGIFQFEDQPQFVGRRRHGSLDDRAVGNPPGGRHPLRQGLRLAGDVEAGDRNRALRARHRRSPSVPDNCVSNNVPPISEGASPSADTVTSRREPTSIPAGRSAVTITAATLRLRNAAAADVDAHAIEHRTESPAR